MVYAIFKPFLNEKLKSRIIFHGNDRESLHKYVSPDCLFPLYGGTVTLPRIDGNKWLECLLEIETEFKGNFDEK